VSKLELRNAFSICFISFFKTFQVTDRKTSQLISIGQCTSNLQQKLKSQTKNVIISDHAILASVQIVCVSQQPPPTPTPHLNNEIGQSEVCQNANYVMHFLCVLLRPSNRVAGAYFGC
jgi:hypothetical protein